MRRSELIGEICAYILCDDKEMQDFIHNHCEDLEEEKIVRECNDFVRLPQKAKALFLRNKTHIYAKVKLLEDMEG